MADRKETIIWKGARNVKEDYGIYLQTGQKSPAMIKYIELADANAEERKEQIKESKKKWGLWKEKKKTEKEYNNR